MLVDSLVDVCTETSVVIWSLW